MEHLFGPLFSCYEDAAPREQIMYAQQLQELSILPSRSSSQRSISTGIEESDTVIKKQQLMQENQSQTCTSPPPFDQHWCGCWCRYCAVSRDCGEMRDGAKL
jgi:hypothetical protein